MLIRWMAGFLSDPLTLPDPNQFPLTVAHACDRLVAPDDVQAFFELDVAVNFSQCSHPRARFIKVSESNASWSEVRVRVRVSVL